MTALAYREDTQLARVPPAPATARFWGPRGAPSDAVVSTLARLTLVPAREVHVDRLLLTPASQGGVRAVIRVGEALQFRAGPGDFVLEPHE